MKNLLLHFALLILMVACGTDASDSNLLPVDFQKKIKSTTDAVVLDVRTPEEVVHGIIPGAMVMDYNGADFKSTLSGLDKSKTYFVYCASGGRSSKAIDLMKEQGFKNVFGLKGGTKAWIKEGLEMVNP